MWVHARNTARLESRDIREWAKLAGADEIDLLLPKYRKEQGGLKAHLALFEEENSEQRETAQNAEKWVALIRQYSDLQELITKIYVGDVRKVDGEKVQSIEIHYRFIGSLPNDADKKTILN